MSVQHTHRLYGLTIRSPFALPGAPILHAPVNGSLGAGEQAVPMDVSLSWRPDSDWNAERWHVTRAAPDAAHPELGAADDGSLYLGWGAELRVTINPRRDEVCVFSRAAKLEFAPTVVVGIVLGYLLHLRGVLCLHGSALAQAGTCIAVLGDSGAGKSTVAAALVKQGHRLLSDDLLAIPRSTGPHSTGPHSTGEVRVHPGSMGLRLMQNSAARLLPDQDAVLGHVPWTRKRLWDLSRDAGELGRDAQPLTAMYLLEPGASGTGVALGEALSRSAALQRLVSAWYPPENLQLLTQERLQHMQQVAARVPVHVLRYAREWACLEQMTELLGNHWAGLDARQRRRR